MKMKSTLLAAAALTCAVVAASPLDELVPAPRSAVERYGEASAAALAKVRVVRAAVPGAPADVADEAYSLEISSGGVTITAPGEKGERWARVTLAQLGRLSGGKVKCCAIVDWPRFRWRGFMHDSARNYLEPKHVKAVIDFMSAYKMNLFHWHLTEYYGWRLESKVFPELQKPDSFYIRDIGKFYTHEEFKEIVDYAHARGVTVMPEFDVPGHALAFRRAFGFETMRDAGVQEKLCALVDELCSLVPADKMPFIHLGSDEARLPEEKVPRGWMQPIVDRVHAAGRVAVGWTPGEFAGVERKGPMVGMRWGKPESIGVSGTMPFFDAFGMYLDAIDPFELLARATYRRICPWDPAIGEKLGAITCAWHDDYAGGGDRTLVNQTVFPALAAFSDAYWCGRDGSEYPGHLCRLPAAGDPRLSAAADLERRLAAQRDRALPEDFAYPFQFLRQTDMRWRISDGNGNVVARDVAQATMFLWKNNNNPTADGAGGNFLTNRTGVAVCETWILSPEDQTVGAWIGFTDYTRDHGRAYSAPTPAEGQWSRHGAKVEINGVAVQPPKWKKPGQKAGGNVKHLLYVHELDEIPFEDEEYYMREPTPITLRKGWNHVKLMVPMTDPARNHAPWVATFAPLLGTTARPREVPGLRYRADPPPEVSWSIMHPTAINVDYMKRVVEKAREYGGVDSFEVCGDCHSPYGGINGLSMLDPYPEAHALTDPKRVEKARADLNAIVDLAHGIGLPLYYWHREIFIPKGLLKDLPQMLDEDGEFDLLGRTYQDYLRFKIGETFKYVPGLDGIVLTLTEADFSVIHNSNPGRYPPPKVVEALVRIFAEEHAKRGKRFILRSFGSIKKDYEDIIAGAVAAARDFGFEVETKVTQADFVPWLPKNPFLKKNPPLTLGAECDALGEYLGAGYLPAAQVARIREYVESAREEGTDRYTLRIDRVGNSIFDSAHEVNLYAYMRFIADPAATVDQVYAEYAAKHYGEAADEMAALEKTELELVRNIHYIASNLTFHSFPIKSNFKTVKAGGIFAVYRENADLSMSGGSWSILSHMRTPPHAQIMAEKAKGLRAAEAGLAKVESLRGKLPPAEYERLSRAWRNAVKAAHALTAYTSCVIAYFEDMAAGRDRPAGLEAAVAEGVSKIESMMKNVNEDFTGAGRHFSVVGDNLDRVYFAGLRFFCRELLHEYALERAQRRAYEKRSDVLDFVIPGGIYDDNRVYRAMHGAYSVTKADRVVRYAGNPVFPNGTITVKFKAVPGAKVEVALDPEGAQEYSISETEENGVKTVVIGKKGAAYPGILGIALVRR